jgi:hypothetical protein
MHHLSLQQKDRFINRCSQALEPHDYLMAADPTKREDEDKGAFTKRWWAVCRTKWNALSDEGKVFIHEHT